MFFKKIENIFSFSKKHLYCFCLVFFWSLAKPKTLKKKTFVSVWSFFALTTYILRFSLLVCSFESSKKRDKKNFVKKNKLKYERTNMIFSHNSYDYENDDYILRVVEFAPKNQSQWGGRRRRGRRQHHPREKQHHSKKRRRMQHNPIQVSWILGGAPPLPLWLPSSPLLWECALFFNRLKRGQRLISFAFVFCQRKKQKRLSQLFFLRREPERPLIIDVFESFRQSYWKKTKYWNLNI